MKKKIEITYEQWEEFINSLENFKLNDDLNDYYILKEVECLWKLMSEKYFLSYNDLPNRLTDIWCETKDLDKFENYLKMYNSFLNYLDYCSDRMNVNRWLRCQLLLQNCTQECYSKFDIELGKDNCFLRTEQIEEKYGVQDKY